MVHGMHWFVEVWAEQNAIRLAITGNIWTFISAHRVKAHLEAGGIDWSIADVFMNENFFPPYWHMVDYGLRESPNLARHISLRNLMTSQ